MSRGPSKRSGGNRVLILLGGIAVVSLIVYFLMRPAQSASACVVDGVCAVCRSLAVERQAKTIVLRQCRRCDPSDVADLIYSLEMNRGPYESAADLARDVLRQVRP